MEQPGKPNLQDLRIDRSSAPSNKRGLATAAGIVLLLAIALAAFWWFKNSSRMTAATVKTLVVSASQTSGATGARVVLNTSGYVTARREATVSSKVTGKVLEVMVEEGMRVHEGQILARIDDTNIRASLRLAEAQWAAATNALAETTVRIREARREWKRQTDLTKNNIATQADLERAEATADALDARLQQQRVEAIVAERQVASWQQQLDDTLIRAPFAGIVTSKNAQPGEMISPMSAGGGFTRTGICTIVDMDSLEVEVDVNESYINRVFAGQPVLATLDAYPDWTIPCKVIAIIPTADRQKSTVRVRVGFEKLDKRILPQMSVKAGFQENAQSGSAEPSSPTMLVPKTAVHKDNGRDIVFVVRDDKAERVAVRTADATGEQAAITAGLNSGERVIIESDRALQDKMPVRQAGTQR